MRTRQWQGWRGVALATGAAAAAAIVLAAPRADASDASQASEAAIPAEFRGADLALGEQLIREHRCASCHTRLVGGDGNAIYRPQGRINRAAALLSMVEVCSVELKLQLFPEDIQAIAAVLQRDHYRFAATP